MFKNKKKEYNEFLDRFKTILIDAEETKITWFIKNLQFLQADDVMDLAIFAYKEIQLIPNYHIQTNWINLLMSSGNKYFQSMLLWTICSENNTLTIETKRVIEGVFVQDIIASRNGFGVQFQYVLDKRTEKDHIAYNTIPLIVYGYYNGQLNPFYVWKELNDNLSEETIINLFNNKNSLQSGFQRTMDFIKSMPYNPEIFCSFLNYFDRLEYNAETFGWLKVFLEAQDQFHNRIMNQHVVTKSIHNSPNSLLH